jgi:hypothetical protein
MKDASVTIIVGVMGSGKTFYARQQCRARPRVLIIDPKSKDPAGRPVEYDEPYKLAGAQFFDGDLNEHREDLKRLLSRNLFTAVFRRDTPPEQVVALAESVGRVHFHFDELNLYKNEPEVIRPLIRMIQSSRALGISFSACSQRPQELPRELTELVTEIVVFRVIGERAKDYLAGYDAGMDFDRISALNRGQYLRYRFGITDRPMPVGAAPASVDS